MNARVLEAEQAGRVPKHFRFECTCGWSLDVVPDVDGDRSSVKCSECAGVAVRRLVQVTP